MLKAWPTDASGTQQVKTSSIFTASKGDESRRQEWQHLRNQLSQYPHTFLLEDEHDQLGKADLVRLSNGLKSALKARYETPLETVRAKNYLAFLLSRQGLQSEALDTVEEFEEGEVYNLVSLANRAVILWRMGRFEEAQMQVFGLEMLKTDVEDFDYLKIKAKAELAFVYSRMGPGFCSKAVDLFKEVTERAREPEKWLWMFGMGLTKRRLLPLMCPSASQEQDVSAESTKTLDIFLSVINSSSPTPQSEHINPSTPTLSRSDKSLGPEVAASQSRNINPASATAASTTRGTGPFSPAAPSAHSSGGRCESERVKRPASRKLMAKAYSEIAILIGRVVWNKKEKQRLIDRAGLTPQEACKKALELDDNDSSVLCKVSKVLRKDRYVNDFSHLPFNDPIQLLEKALSIRPSATAFHRLGLKYLANAKEKKMREQKDSGKRNPPTKQKKRPEGKGSQEEASRWQDFFCAAVDNIATKQKQIQEQRHSQNQEASQWQDFLFAAVEGIAEVVGGRNTACENQPDSLYAMRRNEKERNCFRLFESVQKHMEYTPLSQADPLVSKAMRCLQKALDFSEGKHHQALYDLALLHKYVGETGRARDLLEEVMRWEPFSYLTVNAQEQLGLILVEQNQAERGAISGPLSPRNSGDHGSMGHAVKGEASTPSDHRSRAVMGACNPSNPRNPRNRDMMGAAFNPSSPRNPRGRAESTATGISESFQMTPEAESAFYRALEIAVQLYSKNPNYKGRIGDIWVPFMQNLKDIDKSKLNDLKKLKRKTRLFLQISDTQETRDLLEKPDFRFGWAREHCNLLTRHINGLLEKGETQKAMAFIEVVRTTPEGAEAVAGLFQ